MSENTYNEFFLTTTDAVIISKVKKEFLPYIRWKENLLSNFNVENIEVRDIFMFGSRVGFVVVNAKCYDKLTNKQVPSYAFLRGDSVSIMPVIHCDGIVYTVFATEARTPIGNPFQTSLPAGMIDDGTFVSAALKELVEEVGPEFNVEQKDLIDLGSYPVSAGGTDEFLKLYAFEKTIDREILDKINGRITGAEGENEHIKVTVQPLDDILTHNCDMRSVLSYYKWKDINK